MDRSWSFSFFVFNMEKGRTVDGQYTMPYDINYLQLHIDIAYPIIKETYPAENSSHLRFDPPGCCFSFRYILYYEQIIPIIQWFFEQIYPAVSLIQFPDIIPGVHPGIFVL